MYLVILWLRGLYEVLCLAIYSVVYIFSIVMFEVNGAVEIGIVLLRDTIDGEWL